jgi:acetolactate decarboxylase
VSSFAPAASGDRYAGSMPHIEIAVSESVWRGIEQRREDTGESRSQIVDSLLSEALGLQRHTLFQLSTSNALVQGIFDGTTNVGELKKHGDFGLGTFAGLDGELIMIDGDCFRATATGTTSPAGDDWETPFALVTRFHADIETTIDEAPSIDHLTAGLDRLRPSDNVFVGLRIEGRFDELSMRAACPARAGESLVEATARQSEFTVTELDGTLVGFWAPEYAGSVSVPGYHFHFISDDRSVGGHVLGCRTAGLVVRIHNESDLHLALPETAEFLSADLRGDHSAALHEAETKRTSS